LGLIVGVSVRRLRASTAIDVRCVGPVYGCRGGACMGVRVRVVYLPPPMCSLLMDLHGLLLGLVAVPSRGGGGRVLS